MLSQPATYIKALVGAVMAVLSALVIALDDGHMEGSDWVKILGVAVVAFGAIFASPANKPAAPPGP